jgi:hypothetical protein
VARRSARKEASLRDDRPRATTGHLLGYARIFRDDDPPTAGQAKALRAAGCSRIFRVGPESL